MQAQNYVIDMHTHSSMSDGSLSLQELVDEAFEKKLDALVITDHDTINHFSCIDALSVPKNLTVYKGLELSCVDPATGKTVHLLAYGLDVHTSNLAFIELARKTLEQRLEQSFYITQSLIAEGAQITWEEVALTAKNSTTVYGGSVLDVLIEKEKNERLESYKKLYRRLKAQCNESFTYPSYMEGLKALNASGAKVVLAHPGRSKALHLVESLAREGLFGIERNHPDNTEQVRKEIDELAYRFKLVRTGGSDYHGTNSPRKLAQDVGRILRTFKIKKNVEVTDNGKIII